MHAHPAGSAFHLNNNIEGGLPMYLDLFEKSVQAYSTKPALCFEGAFMSYAQLDRESSRVACALAACGVGRGDIIVIRLPRGFEAVAAMIGVMKAGAAICVVEEGYPQDRIDFIISDTMAKIIIDGPFMASLPENIAMDLPKAQSNDPAIVVYTSGSTGNPKGVVNPHRALSMAVRNSVLIRTAQDIFLSAASFSFIAVALEIFTPLTLGGTIHIAGDNLRRDAQALADYVCQHGITTAFFPPQMARIVLPQLEDQLLSMVVASERVVNLYSNRVRIFNLYGCSETCSTLTCFEINRSYPDGTPIGKPCAGSRVYILDDEGNLLPDGQEGEICVSGQIASGYLNLPELTAERFIPNPFSQGEDDQILFRTNDIGRINENGQLEYVQRKDWMVKVRGYRVEPGEIEAAIVRSTPAEQAVVKGFTNALGETSLFGVYTAQSPLSPEAIVSAIGAFLPSYMIPAFLEQVDRLPLNPNGKVDRKNILPPDIAKFKAPYQAPENEREQAICEAFRQVIGLEQVGILDDFNLIGGDSISAAKVQAALPGLGISTSDILSLGTPQKLAAHNLAGKLEKAAPRKIWPLTFTERQMATEQGMNPDSVAYNINSLALRIEGTFHADKLEEALNALCERHAVLRSYYPMNGGEYEHRIREKMPLSIARRACAADDVIGIIEAENRPFDLAGDPLVRCQLFDHGGNLYTLHFCFHHIIMDGSSWPAFESELFSLYRGEALPPLAFDHQDYAVWQAEHADLRAQEAAFKDMFQEGVPENEMPTHASRPDTLPYADTDLVRMISSQKLSGAAKRLGTTQYGLLLSVLGMTLGKYSASEDVIVGTAMSGRTLPEQENMIGMFVNTLPLRMKPIGDMPLKAFALETAKAIRTVKANQTYPFERLVPLLAPDRNASRAPVFDVIFNYLPEQPVPVLDGARVSYLPVKGQALQMDLVLEALQEGENTRLVLSYSRKLYDDSVAENFLEQFLTTLERCCDLDGDTLLADLCELPPRQYRQIVCDFPGERVKGWQGKTMISLFSEQAAKTPQNSAVVFQGKCLTYAQLDDITNRLAAHLISLGAGKGGVVGVMVSRGMMMPIGALSVLKTGAAYLPMDPSYPSDRLQYMLEDAGVRILLCDPALAGRVPDFTGVIVSSTDVGALPAAAPVPDQSRPEDLFILLYTSGTTGKPKGVMLTHNNLVNYTHFYASAYGICETDRIPAYASFGFDANMMDMYPTLLTGACLHVLPEEMRLDLPGIRDYFEENQITVAFLTTQLGRQFAESMRVSSLRALSVGGEALVPLNPPPFDLFNLYGPTECTVACTRQRVDRLYDRVPIGKPTPNTALYVVDSRDRLAPVGVAGELCISGGQVAAGYLNRPDLTEEKFVPNPFSNDPAFSRMYKSGDVVRYLPDGTIDFVGRRDFQVKIRGFRVELTEIEGRIRAFAGIRDAAVIAQEDAGGGKRVVAYVVSDAPVHIKALNAFIEEELPPYMVPAATMQIERIPLNQNGKVNRRELPRIQIQAEESIPPRTDMEKAIFEVVAGVLKTEAFGVTTDLMYAGLNSLSAIKAAALITERTGKNLRTMELMREKTIEKIAVLLDKSSAYEAKSYEKREYYPLTQNQLGLYFACIKDPGTLVYNIPFEITFGPDTDAQQLLESVQRVVNAHKYMKTHFALRDNEPVQLRQDELAIDIPIITCTEEEYEAKKAAFVRPFSFFEGPLLRLEICRTPHGIRMLCDFHHMIFDGGSMDIFLQDLSAAYRGEALQAEAFSSFDLALLEQESAQGDALALAKAFFHQRLGDGEGATLFPTDSPAGSAGLPRSVHAKISKSSVADAIKGQSITASNLFLAATSLVAGRFASTRDVRIASITNGREGVYVQRSIGMLVKTLPVALKMNPDDTASACLHSVQQEMTDVLSHQAYSYLQAASDYGYNSQMLYAYQGGVVSDYSVEGTPIALTPLGLNRAKFPISINIQEDAQSFTVEAEYDDSLYAEATMRTLAQCIAYTAGQLACKPEERIGAMCICTGEQRALVQSFGQKPESMPSGALHQLFEAWAMRTPEQPALIARDAQFTFAQLNARANALAHSLLSLGVQPEDRIAFMLPRDSRILISMLGIIKAGCAYIPVDPEYPRERVEHVLSDSGARFILTNGDSPLANSLHIDDLLLCENTENPGLPIHSNRLCYIIYTSGSTGKPKGVMLTHGGIVNYVLDDPQNRHVHALVENRCIMASVTTVSFDMFLKEAFTTLMNGLTLVLADDEQAKNPDQLAALFRKTGANAFNATPSRMLQYMELPDMKQALAQCKVIMAGGEGYPPALYRKLREITDATLINTYGPTEITVSSNGKLLESERITIGAPLKGVVEEVMDIEGHPLPVGFTGELWIGGNGVARGYFGNPEMTAQRFVEHGGMRWYKSGDVARWTEDGEIVILGRNDGQIKLRGLRIELGEIENAIRAVAEIRSCAVLVKKLHGQDHLCAYYSAQRDLPAEELREILLRSLTKYMVPTAYLQMDCLPMTPNGKIDRKALPDAKLMQRQEYEPPRNENEQILCDIFAGILHLDRVGATDNFFDMGGTSLLVTQLTIDAAAKGMALSYGDVFANPTPRELAALGQTPKEKADQHLIEDYDYAPIHTLLEENTLDALRMGEMHALGNVCITGATGFLGIHVLRAFLQTEKGTAFCVVRGRKQLSAEKRLRSMLAYYFGGDELPFNGKAFLDALDELMGSRIVVIDGNITDPALYQALDALPIDTYINCAANVKHFSAGTDIEDVNLGGVKLALDFCKGKRCRFVQVSTASIGGMSVNGQPLETEKLDERMLYFGQDLSNKYAGSKFLAERAILEAALQGLDVKIMRVGNLMARDADGEFQANFRTNNFLSRLKAYHLVGAIPYEAMGMSTEFAPIDYTALSVLLLSKTPKACRVFHPYNDHDVFLGDAVSALAKQGIVIEPCEACEYERRFSEAMRDPQKAKHLNALIAYQEHGKRIVPIKSVNSYTSQVLLRLGFMWPITSEQYLSQFFVMMKGLGFFDHDSAL
ncbi:MAG: amino acid adenylation domain-containing protein [Clostridiales bacterium]|nr:amino acid adenylation domain-containing protein [Clostridiales bacterium]